MQRNMHRAHWRQSGDWQPIRSRGKDDLNRHERRFRAARHRLFT